MLDWQYIYAAAYRAKKDYLKPIKYIDEISLEDLIGIADQKQQLVANTQAFIDNKPYNNALLWGSRGCGKSSLIKAVFNHFKAQGLRIIEIESQDLTNLLDIVDEIRGLEYHFIIFCDDFSFEAHDSSYRGLKRVLDGSIEAKPNNIVIYASSNRRHLVPEPMSDNEQVTLGNNGEIHFSDAVEERIALSDRFGLTLSFYSNDQQKYLDIVDGYFSDFKGDKTNLHQAAMNFAMMRGNRSGRTAKQFYNSFGQMNCSR